MEPKRVVTFKKEKIFLGCHIVLNKNLQTFIRVKSFKLKRVIVLDALWNLMFEKILITNFNIMRGTYINQIKIFRRSKI